ncbi:MAG TPA: rRNA maturation RNase YbeY [Acidimicrobiia bacterium]|jgi:probable rRNA maturation factor
MSVQFADEQDDPLEPGQLVELAERVLAAELCPEGTEVSLTMVDEQAMSEHNERHLGKLGATDVLSFPIEDLSPGVPPQRVPGGPPPVLGDVLVCPAVVRANAAAGAVRFEDEMALMVVHGLLHLLGYDHVDDAEAELMEGRERELLASAGRVKPS